MTVEELYNKKEKIQVLVGEFEFNMQIYAEIQFTDGHIQRVDCNELSDIELATGLDITLKDLELIYKGRLPKAGLMYMRFHCQISQSNIDFINFFITIV